MIHPLLLLLLIAFVIFPLLCTGLLLSAVMYGRGWIEMEGGDGEMEETR